MTVNELIAALQALAGDLIVGVSECNCGKYDECDILEIQRLTITKECWSVQHQKMIHVLLE